jgi:hypothetical protein
MPRVFIKKHEKFIREYENFHILRLVFASLGEVKAQKEGNNPGFCNNKVPFNTAPPRVDSTQTWVALMPRRENQTALSGSAGNLIAYFPFGRGGRGKRRHSHVARHVRLSWKVVCHATRFGDLFMCLNENECSCLNTLEINTYAA